MQITFVSAKTQLTLKNLLISESSAPSNIYIFASEAQTKIDYGEELAGKTRVFEDITLLSKKGNAVVLFSAVTSTKGHLRRSVAVADNGSLLGVTDMTYSVEKGISAGANLRVYETKQGKIGVLVADDFYFPDRAQTLADCGAEYLICLLPRFDGVDSAVVRAYGKCFSTPVIYCADGVSMIADEKGELLFSSPLSPVRFGVEPKAEYKLVQMRKRRG